MSGPVGPVEPSGTVAVVIAELDEWHRQFLCRSAGPRLSQSMTHSPPSIGSRKLSAHTSRLNNCVRPDGQNTSCSARKPGTEHGRRPAVRMFPTTPASGRGRRTNRRRPTRTGGTDHGWPRVSAASSILGGVGPGLRLRASRGPVPGQRRAPRHRGGPQRRSDRAGPTPRADRHLSTSRRHRVAAAAGILRRGRLPLRPHPHAPHRAAAAHRPDRDMAPPRRMAARHGRRRSLDRNAEQLAPRPRPHAVAPRRHRHLPFLAAAG